ncbi:MAG: DUF1109 family protein [Reyranella sp.]|uniref:NrsF family protein n=1 Tax=Reyranella sp. TaxID=1929291 RepID=UPI001AD13865|nr:NrsF family protein [Reyranella sp.]MBN9090786.1 DUF1109 family protein [Reyranella sp.]
MKTEQLVEALVADRPAARRPLARSLGWALAAGGVVSLAVFFLELGIRPDIGPALATWRFDLKVAMVLLGLVLAFGVCLDCSRPDMPRHPLRRLLPLLAVLAAAVAIELVSVPRSAWQGRLVGTNAMICLPMVPILSLAPLAAALLILRRGAPASPALAGAAAGLLAALCGASLYAFHCFDDSPLFVATWYTLAAAPMVAIGTLAGRRLLRW